MDNLELKPCPFCGGKAELMKSRSFELYKVSCENKDCIAHLNYHWVNSEEQAINEWNPRAGIVPPINVGDTVYSLLENYDGGDTEGWHSITNEAGDVFYIYPFKVCGIAFINDKWYVTDFDGELFEIGKGIYLSEAEALKELEKLK